MVLNFPKKTINDKNNPRYRIKQIIWLYFYLLIFEGALRKWVVPGLATPILLIREPLVIWLVFTAWRNGIIQMNIYLLTTAFVGFLGIITAILFGHGSIPVALYGARILLFHYPLIFVIGAVFTRKDILKLGEVVLKISIPMAVLIVLQFYSPQSAWINRGVGGDESGGGFSGALGFFRPPGTFSFTNGTTLFFGLLAPFIMYFWLYSAKINKLLLICATASLLISIPISISRTLLFEVAVTCGFTVYALSKKPQFLGKFFMAALIITFSMLLLSNLSFFQTATEAFTARFVGANESEGGLNGVVGNRYFGQMIEAFTDAGNLPFFGYGLGSGTQIGFKILGLRAVLFKVEDEFTRIIGEMGFALGVLAIFCRLGICVQLFKDGYNKLKHGDVLPWLLLSFGLLTVPQGQWAQPTALGFGVIIGGLVLASINLNGASND